MKCSRLALVALMAVLLLALGTRPTGHAQSFTNLLYLPAIRYLNPCAASSVPEITRPPTRQRLAFIHDNYQSPDSWDLYMANADDTSRSRLTNDFAVESRPTWSPDGKQIAYVSALYNNGSSTTSLKLLRLSDRHITTIHTWPDGVFVFDPAWSPDGRQIAFAINQNQKMSIGVIQTNGANQRLLASTGDNRYPSWSPDGTRIAYSSFRGNQSHLYVIQADGTQDTQVTNQPVWDREPAWSPDGSRIAFTSGCLDTSQTSHESIYIIQADGSGRIHIPIPQSFGGGTFDGQTAPAWSPDGTQIAYTQSFFKGSAIVIVNLNGSGFSRLGITLDAIASWAPR